ncbi:MAG: hypothetical protein F4153_00075 [Acidimicrobiia bacterium]|nr:hypothetical protein [Acidimicrobiia bacterium]
MIDSVTVLGPVEGGASPANAARQDLGAAGYIEAEYFVEGEATSYELLGERTTDGRWEAVSDGTAAFRTRMMVRRPIDPTRFSGVVVVEWFNVSAGGDSDPGWAFLYPELLREGHVWVGVSAQAVGVDGGPSAGGGAALVGGLVPGDRERYGSLAHPGDGYSFDIYSRVGAALLAPDGPDPLGGLEPSNLVAIGVSQSALYLTTYVNAVHPLVRVYDSFLLHSRAGMAPTLNGLQIGGGGGVEGAARGAPVQIRTDLTVPVLIFQTETDLTVLGYARARQDDTDTVRIWEVAGTAHADAYILAELYGFDPEGGAMPGSSVRLNNGPQHEVLLAGFHHLVGWMRDGLVPPASPRLEVDMSGAEPVIVRDERGNARGGIRTPLVDVPVATLSGDPVEGSGMLGALSGFTEPFDESTLAELYPTHGDYIDAFIASADASVAAGFILRREADALIATAYDDQPSRPE